MGTLRTVITIKGKTLYASIVGFFEVFIWFSVVKEALNTDEKSIWIGIAYALGFATGTLIGGFLSSKLISGNLGVQIITDQAHQELVPLLRSQGYGVTVMNVQGKDSDKYMLFIEINNKSLEKLKKLVKSIDNDAFIVINETKHVHNGFLNGVAK